MRFQILSALVFITLLLLHATCTTWLIVLVRTFPFSNCMRHILFKKFYKIEIINRIELTYYCKIVANREDIRYLQLFGKIQNM